MSGPHPAPSSAPGWGYDIAPRTNTKAAIALGLAIGAYTPVVPFIGAIVALILARSARQEIRVSAGRQTGEDLCTWAVVLSVVHLVLISLLLVAGLLLVVLPFLLSVG